MKLFKTLTLAALTAGALTFAGCERRSEPRLEDSMEEVGDETREMGRDVEENVDDGIGGSGEGLDIGENEGVIRDGEGPLENEETRPGENPGVINDGEGPIEENF